MEEHGGRPFTSSGTQRGYNNNIKRRHKQVLHLVAIDTPTDTDGVLLSALSHKDLKDTATAPRDIKQYILPVVSQLSLFVRKNTLMLTDHNSFKVIIKNCLTRLTKRK